MKRILKQSIFALLISSVLAFNGLAQPVSVSYDFLQDKDKKPSEKPKEKPKEPRDKPKDEKKDDKKKPEKSG